MLDGLFQPAHLMVGVALCLGLYGFVYLIRKAWHGKG
jgi:hypothetical protein